MFTRLSEKSKFCLAKILLVDFETQIGSIEESCEIPNSAFQETSIFKSSLILQVMVAYFKGEM